LISNQNQKWGTEFKELKLELKELSTNIIDRITPEIAPLISLEISKIFSLVETEDSRLRISNLMINCPDCDHVFSGYFNSLNFCPNCHLSSFYPADLTYKDFKLHLSEISDTNINKISLDIAPKVATGLIDTTASLERIDHSVSSNIKCPECNHEFLDFDYLYTHHCPNCNNIFSLYKENYIILDDTHGSVIRLDGSTIQWNDINSPILGFDDISGSTIQWNGINSPILKFDDISGSVIKWGDINGSILKLNDISGSVIQLGDINGLTMRLDGIHGSVIKLYDTPLKLDGVQLSNSAKIICPECNHEFQGFRNLLNTCPDCNHFFYSKEVFD
ncbi:hypothetical protein LCGC14_2417750, partial [marine sediment metagenome]